LHYAGGQAYGKSFEANTILFGREWRLNKEVYVGIRRNPATPFSSTGASFEAAQAAVTTSATTIRPIVLFSALAVGVNFVLVGWVAWARIHRHGNGLWLGRDRRLSRLRWCEISLWRRHRSVHVWIV